MEKKFRVVLGLISAMLLASIGLVVAAVAPHSHTYGEKWESNEKYHWHEATCKHSDEVGSKAEHNFNVGVITTAPTCDKDGEITRTCGCGATKTEKIKSIGHAYAWEMKQEGTCVTADVFEGTCSGCDSKVTKEELDTEKHTWGEWKVAKEATCVSLGEKQRICVHNAAHKESSEIPLERHNYVGYQVVKTPTETKEGQIKARCTSSNCGKEVVLKMLKTPKVTQDGVTLTWGEVTKAKGYKLYDNGKLVADLGKVLNYNVSTTAGIHNYTVEAYTGSIKYHDVSLKSKALQVKVAFGENLQKPKGTNFEGFTEKTSVEIINQWLNDYFNGGAGKVEMIKDGNNTCAKLTPVTNNGEVTLTKACNTNILKAGTYQLKMDVKLGSAADGKVSFGIFDGSDWTPSWPKLVINTASANAYGWKTVTHTFTVPTDKTVEYANLDLTYTGVAQGENNYILVDNIQIVNKATNVNVDADKNGNMENFFTPLSDLLKTSGWKSDGEKDVIFVSDYSLENKLVAEADGNKAFKFYTATGVSANADFAGNTEIAKAGTYKMKVRVKGGVDATKVDNIGFRFYAEGGTLGTGDITFTGLEKLSSKNWTVLEAYFTVPKTVKTNYVNINFWVFTNNDKIGSANNYVLMDDIEVYPVIINGCDHEYDVYKMTTTPTTTTEGEMTAKCKKPNCKEALTLKVLMTPELSRTDAKLTWKEVPNATGYKVYKKDAVVANLVNVFEYDIPLEAGTYQYTVEAYTDKVGYHNVSLKSEEVKVTIALGDNLQASKGTDFEGFVETKSVNVTNQWSNGYANFGAGTIQLLREGNNTFAKLKPASNNSEVILTRACNVAVLKAGTYKFSLDVKLGSAADGTLSFGIWDGRQWTPGWPKAVIDTSAATKDGWTTVTYQFTIPSNRTGTYANLDLAYTGKTAGENNYILVDNIQMINTATNKNVDTNAYGDFEGTVPSLADMLKASGWKKDGANKEVIYVSPGALENELVVEDDGNKCFKFYTSNGESTSVDFSGSTAFATAGTYKLKMKVKLGSEATKVDNIGFRFFAGAALGTNDVSFSKLDELTSDGWVTLEASFTVPRTVATGYINMNFWVFTHNDEIQSADNYVLVDDIEICKVTISE